MAIFRTVEESIELEKLGLAAESGFQYVFNMEETQFETFDLKSDIKEQLDHIRRNNKRAIKVVEAGDEPFDEFTSVICDAFLERIEY